MKFNWISVNEADEKLKKFCIELEYRLRPQITRFLLSHLETECCGDFSCFYFDVDVSSQQVTIAKQTPVEYRQRIAYDFDREFNGKLAIT